MWWNVSASWWYFSAPKICNPRVEGALTSLSFHFSFREKRIRSRKSSETHFLLNLENFEARFYISRNFDYCTQPGNVLATVFFQPLVKVLMIWTIFAKETKKTLFALLDLGLKKHEISHPNTLRHPLLNVKLLAKLKFFSRNVARCLYENMDGNSLCSKKLS